MPWMVQLSEHREERWLKEPLNCLEFRVGLAYSPAYSFSRDDEQSLG